MTDRKTIMSWLEGLAEPNWRMFHSDSEVQNIAKETLNLLKEQEEAHKILVETADEMYAMLKEQEAVKPVLFGTMWECGNCHSHTPVGIYLDDRRDDFCRKCGKKVQWDA